VLTPSALERSVSTASGYICGGGSPLLTRLFWQLNGPQVDRAVLKSERQASPTRTIYWGCYSSLTPSPLRSVIMTSSNKTKSHSKSQSHKTKQKTGSKK